MSTRLALVAHDTDARHGPTIKRVIRGTIGVGRPAAAVRWLLTSPGPTPGGGHHIYHRVVELAYGDRRGSMPDRELLRRGSDAADKILPGRVYTLPDIVEAALRRALHRLEQRDLPGGIREVRGALEILEGGS